MPASPTEHDGSDAVSPEEAFALLGNDTRVGILRALWERFESGRADNALPYSELFKQVDIEDSGNFSYHLEKLTGPFVRQTDGGYELKQTGINVVRAVVAGTVTVDPSLGPTRVDVDCPICDAPVEIVYADEFMNVYCTGCEGRSRWNDQPGHLFGALVPPVGVDQHSVAEAFRAAVTYSLYETAIFHEGVCPHCLGPVDTTVDACVDHEPEETGRCPNCDRRNLADVWMVCATCKRSVPPPASLVVLGEPTVTAFYHDHGVEHRFATWETVARSYRVRATLVAADPLRIELAVPAEDDELRLVLDDDANVVDETCCG
jgi:hypothetical protein